MDRETVSPAILMVVGILQVKEKVSMPNAVMFGKGHLVTKDINYSGFSVFVPFLSPRSRKFIEESIYRGFQIQRVSL